MSESERERREHREDLEDLLEIERIRHDTEGDRPLEEVLAELGIKMPADEWNPGAGPAADRQP